MISTSHEDYLSRITAAIDTVRPYLRADGGDVEIIALDENFNLSLKLIGACSSCNMSQMTMTAGIEDAIRRAVPEVRQVRSE